MGRKPLKLEVFLTKPDLILVDMNAIANASLYQPNLANLTWEEPRSGEKQLVGSIIGSINAIHNQIKASTITDGAIAKSFPGAMVVGLWDGRTQFRYDLVSQYKSGRRADPNSNDPKVREKAYKQAQLKLQVPVIQKLLNSLGVAQVRHPLLEADDLFYWACSRAPSTMNVRMMTKDTDMLQNLRPNVHWHQSSPEKTITWDQMTSEGAEIDKEIFFDPQVYIRCKALAGDSSDTIPGIDGVGLKTAQAFYKLFGGFDALWAEVAAGRYIPKGVKAGAICAPIARDIYERNLLMMDSSTVSFAGMQEDLSLTRYEPNKEEFVGECSTLGLNRLSGLFGTFAANHMASREKWEQVESIFQFPDEDDFDEEDC